MDQTHVNPRLDIAYGTHPSRQDYVALESQTVNVCPDECPASETIRIITKEWPG